MTSSTATAYADAETRTIDVGGTTYAYRELGPVGGIPVVLFMHLAGNLDNWDPRIVDALAAHRHVIAFDQPGVGGSGGRVPRTLEESADDAYAFLSALELTTIDVVAFSMGAMIAQDLVLTHPSLVRRLVLAGTGPRGGRDIDKVVLTTYQDVLRATLRRRDPKEYLFFERDAEGDRAAKAFVARLDERTRDRDRRVSLRAFQSQLMAIRRFGRSAPADLSVITQPTLVVNGDHDRMVPSDLSEDLHRRIPGSQLVIYPRSGHGAIFQHHAEFSSLVVEFLGRGERVEP
ncbi:MAG: alpha/beta hydrolase [Candidatus Nanopelagicales bacterium]